MQVQIAEFGKVDTDIQDIACVVAANLLEGTKLRPQRCI